MKPLTKRLLLISPVAIALAFSITIAQYQPQVSKPTPQVSLSTPF